MSFELIEGFREQITSWHKTKGLGIFWPVQFTTLFDTDYELTMEILLTLESEGLLIGRIKYYSAVGETLWSGTIAERGKVTVPYEGVEIYFELVRK